MSRAWPIIGVRARRGLRVAPGFSGGGAPPVDPGQQQVFFTEDTTTDFQNPERGWSGARWGWDWGARAPNNGTHDCPDGSQISPVGRLYTQFGLDIGTLPMRINHYGLNLTAYADQDTIPQSFIDDHAAYLANNVRGSKVKAQMRAYYATNPSSMDRILGHMNQLAPLWNDYADCIAVVEGGFLGPWGEWHSSVHFNTGGRWGEAFDGLLDLVPNSLMVGFRAPKYVLDKYPTPLAYANRFTGTWQSRAGFHNDCISANWSDVGTYETQAHLDYTIAVASYVFNGGETCHTATTQNQYNDGTYADAHLRRIGLNWLNCDYSCYVLYKWLTNNASGDFGHTDGITVAPDSTRWLAWISKRLGYRFALTSVTAPEVVTPNAPMTLTLGMENVGYGALFNPRPMQVVFTNGGGTHVATAVADARRTLPLQNETVTPQVTFNAPASLIAGQTYAMHLRLPDAHASWASDPANSVRFANTGGMWNGVNGWNSLGMNVSVSTS